MNYTTSTNGLDTSCREREKAEADLAKAKAAMAWLTSFWIIVGPPTAFITWLVVR